MTIEQLQELSEDPKKFLNRCKHYEQRIKIKQAQIQHYRDMEYSITSTIKDVPSFVGSVTSKIENCSISIMAIEEDIQKEIETIRQERLLVQEAIAMVDNPDLKSVLEAKYIDEMTWEEIAVQLFYSYRWTLRLHGRALRELSIKAKEATNLYINS